MIIGCVGFQNSGKDTIADFLENEYNFRRDSFAGTLKDAVSAVFGWDRTLVEGRTKEAREWREQVDTWWAERLGMPHLSPRWILQYWGTEVCRIGFHTDIWVASLENKIRKTSNNVVISDVRFPNEIKVIRNAGGIIIRVKRGEDPEWFNDAINMNCGQWPDSFVSKQKIEDLGIHSSETSWVGGDIDYTILNNGTIEQLHDLVSKVIKNLE